MTADNVIHQAADRIQKAYDTGRPDAPIRTLLDEGDIDSAYAIQEVNTKRRIGRGARLIGRKIGLTSKAVQAQLGVDQPDFGMLFDDMAVPDGGIVPAGKALQPRLEGEITYVMERGLAMERPTPSDVMNAVAYAVPSIEIVGSRIKDWDINIQDTIADNASAALFVIGNRKVTLDAFDGRTCGMVLSCDGVPVSVGAGAACLGHPLNAVRWLAIEMVRRGRPLEAGDLVMSGALAPMVPAVPGRLYEVEINGMGTCRVSFAAE